MRFRRTTVYRINADIQEIASLVEQVQQELANRSVSAANAMKACVSLEETLVKIHGQEGCETSVKVLVRSSLRKTYISVISKGRKIEEESLMPEITSDTIANEYGPDAESMIRQMVLRGYADRISYKHSRGVNTIRILAQKSKNADIYDTLTAIIAAIIVGGICRITLPTEVCKSLAENLFSPLYTVFLNAIRMIMAPLVFFSLATCVAGFSDLAALGRTGMKVVMGYASTTFIAIALSLGLIAWFNPLPINLSALNIQTLKEEAEITVSLKDTLINIVPSNLIDSFLRSDMMQIIFISIIVGIAAGSMGKRSEQFLSFLSMFDELFNRITGIIVRFLPFAIFGSFSLMMTTIDLGMMQTMATWVAIVLIAIAVMVTIYLLMLSVIARLNPFVFMRKYIRVLITALSTSSSNASIPSAMECCNSLGISPRIYSFSIPLGATINMNGTSILYTTMTFFLAAITGTNLDSGVVVTLIATIFMLALASPGVPGAGTACEMLLLSIAGVPLGIFALVLGIMPLIEPLLTTINVLSDGIVTTTVAKNEKMLDTQTYYA